MVGLLLPEDRLFKVPLVLILSTHTILVDKFILDIKGRVMQDQRGSPDTVSGIMTKIWWAYIWIRILETFFQEAPSPDLVPNGGLLFLGLP
jgi:hypothetical protein